MLKPIHVLALALWIPVAGISHASLPERCSPFCGPPAWKADEIDCFAYGHPYWQDPNTIPMAFDKEIDRPFRISGSWISKELFKEIKAYPFALRAYLLVNRAGQVEMIFARTSEPEAWDEEDKQIAAKIETRILEVLRHWQFEPAELWGVPNCVWYPVIVNVDINRFTNDTYVSIYPRELR